MAGYNEMLRCIEPEKIVCCNTPFSEMQGDIVYVDYERSDKSEDLESFKIGGQHTSFCDIVNTLENNYNMR